MVEYRPLPDERGEEFRAFVTYAFRPESGPYDPDEDDDLPEPAQLGDRRGVFDGDELLAICRHYWFDARLRGDVHPMAGLSAVATPPENRRRGLVREMLAESLAEYRDRDCYLSALWPFEHSFYARYGWATCTEYVAHECDPDALASARAEAPDGRWERLEADDWERLAPVLAAHGERYELTLDRSEDWWRKRVFRGWETDPYVYAWRDETSDDRAYVVYQVESGDEKTLRVYDAAWRDHDAYLAVLGFLADHDSQVGRVKLYGPADSPLLDVVPDPGEVETELNAGPMVRLVDVAAALDALDYPAVTADVTVDVTDDLAEWNDDVFRLSVADGDASVERTSGPADVSVDVGAIGQLVVGHRSARDLARTRDVGADAAALAALDALFPESRVFLREGF